MTKRNHHRTAWQGITRFLFLFCLGLMGSGNLSAQLSPGKLSQAHSKLEGLTNCTQCHSIGNQITNQKCLACHKVLASRIQANKGLHASPFAKGKACISCHSEHHGEKFDMIRIDKKSFNHANTAFALKGAHVSKIKQCTDCHRAENVANPALKNKASRYVGLEAKCVQCHKDVHQKTLSADCASCHDVNSFKPASLFNHDKTNFELNGAHQKANCNECHKTSIRNGEKFTQFAGVASTNCTSCHKDVHQNQFGQNCKACHTEESFKQINPSRSFNHSVTGYTLEGKHREVSCKKCHANHENTFQEFKKIKDISCVTCHKDIHEGKLGQDCKSCHNQTSFLLKNKNQIGKFDHNKTDYPLRGKHLSVDCKVCHKKDLTDPVPHATCQNCHQDKHNGDFANKSKQYPDCASCHTVEGFSPSLFTLDDHKQSKFQIDGAHEAQPCFACHKRENKWVFNNMGVECKSCHKDIHEGKLATKYYPNQTCATCHNTGNWKSIRFDHNQTTYPLVAKHQTTACGSCHMKDQIQQFGGLNKTCASCHQDVHGKQFDRQGVTDCSRCHQPDGWNANHFNHSTTNYILDGEHRNVACNKCHFANLPSNKRVRLYKIEKFECIDCHL